MKYAAILAAFLLAGAARAQPAPPSPSEQATEQMLLEQMTARRNWQARAIELEAENTGLKQQISEANAAKSKHPPGPAQ